MEAAATRAEAMLRRLGQTIEELGELRNEMIHRTERQAVQLVLAIAERIVQREVTLDRTLLLGMARVALDRLGEYGSATIRLNPDDYQAIGAKPSIDGVGRRGPRRLVGARAADATSNPTSASWMSRPSRSSASWRERCCRTTTSQPDDASDSPHAIALK